MLVAVEGADSVHLRLAPGLDHRGLHDVVASEFRAAQHILDSATQGIPEPTHGLLGGFDVALDHYLVVHGEDRYRSGMLFPASCEQVVHKGEGWSVFT